MTKEDKKDDDSVPPQPATTSLSRHFRKHEPPVGLVTIRSCGVLSNITGETQGGQGPAPPPTLPTNNSTQETRELKGLAKMWDEEDRAAKNKAKKDRMALLAKQTAPTLRPSLSVTQEKLRSTYLETGMKPGAYPDRGPLEDNPESRRYSVAGRHMSTGQISDDGGIYLEGDDGPDIDLEHGVSLREGPLVEAFVVADEQSLVRPMPPPKFGTSTVTLVDGDYVDVATVPPADDKSQRFFDSRVLLLILGLVCCFVIGAAVVLVVVMAVTAKTTTTTTNAFAATATILPTGGLIATVPPTKNPLPLHDENQEALPTIAPPTNPPTIQEIVDTLQPPTFPPTAATDSTAPTTQTIEPTSTSATLTPKVDTASWTTNTPAPTTQTIEPTSMSPTLPPRVDTASWTTNPPSPAPIPATLAPTTPRPTTPRPSRSPTKEPTPDPTRGATPEPSRRPTREATPEPSPEPTREATPEPTREPTREPTPEPTPEPAKAAQATEEPTPSPTDETTPAATDPPRQNSDATARVFFLVVYTMGNDAIDPSQQEQTSLNRALVQFFTDSLKSEVSVSDYEIVSWDQKSDGNLWKQEVTVDYLFQDDLPPIERVLNAFDSADIGVFLNNVAPDVAPTFDNANHIDYEFDIPNYRR